ncbi:hypothetical protein D3C80_1701990 [compost metagenome]
MQQGRQRFDGAGQRQADLDRAIRLGLALLGGGDGHALGDIAAGADVRLRLHLIDGTLHQVGGYGVGVFARQQAVALGGVVAAALQLGLQFRLLKH